MTSTAIRSSTALSVPPSQNTAPVHEFRCLYTHDVRRKQKRWQDGRVRFHTFNKRLMVYDDTQNFIGDTHWKEAGGLQQDEEVMLEVGVLVQVGDLLTTTQTDLAPLFERERKKEKGAPQGIDKPLRTAISRVSPAKPLGNGVAQKHRSLNTLLGGGRGSHGKATLPELSPFEARRANQENDRELEREAKRRKTTVEPWAVTKTTTPLLARSTDERNKRLNQGSMKPTNPKVALRGQTSLSTRQVVDMTLENDHLPLSDVTVLSSPKSLVTISKVAGSMSKPMKPAPRIRVSTSSPIASIREVSPPVSTKNRMRHVEVEVEKEPAEELDEMNSPKMTPLPAKRKQLRIGKQQQRPMLLCQRPTLAVSSKAKEKAAQTRRVNHYQTLSDIENESLEKGFGPNRGHKRPQLETPKQVHHVDLTQFISSPTAASNTGDIILPGRTATQKRDARTPKECIQDQELAQGRLEQKVLIYSPKPMVTTKAKAKKASQPSKVSALARKRPFRHGRCENDVEHEFREDSTLALAGDSGYNIINKRKVAQASKNPKKSTKKPVRGVLSEVETEELTMTKDKMVRLMSANGKHVEAQAQQERKEQGPWTTEATDLFSWRPPNWEERLKRQAEVK